MKGTFCAYSIMHPMVYRVQKYSSEELFDENDMNATGK